MKEYILSSLLICAGFAVFAQSFNKSRMDSLFVSLEKNDRGMGSLTISKDGNVVYQRQTGYSFVKGEEKKAATADTRYRIGSITKVFTATMIFQLIEEGKITLNTTLDTWFPALPNSKIITIAHLLSHRSGLHNFTADQSYLSYMTQGKSEEEMLAIFASSKPDFQPDEKFSYSNTNYALLGYIVGRITKMPYAQALKERISSKIGLSNTYSGTGTDINKNESYSYLFNNGWQQLPETNMTVPGGAGNIVSTPADLTRFIEGLFALKLVSKTSLDQMTTIRDGYGMGLMQIPFFTKKAYGHNGSIDGFNSMLGYFKEDGLAVAYINNGLVYPVNDIMIGVLSIYYNLPYTIPTFKAVTVLAGELQKFAGIYSSPKFPLKITITVNGNQLMAQATGQSAFTLEPTEPNKFSFAPAGINITFDAEKPQLLLQQGGGAILFEKGK